MKADLCCSTPVPPRTRPEKYLEHLTASSTSKQTGIMVRVALVAAIALPFCAAQISDDFESGWDQTKWPIYARDCNQGGTVSLDSTTAHSGKSSIKVTSPGGYCGHIFFGTTAVPSGDVYVRAWIKASTALTGNHATFITMPDTTTGKNLRIGGQSQILMYNRESDDATLPDLSPQGIAASSPLPAGSFQCFEYHIGTDGTIETWLNGNAIAGLQAGPNAGGNAYNKQWGTAYKPKVTGVYFGWESYGGDVNTLWYDDVAISSSRIGCGAGSGSGSSPSSSKPPASTTRATSSTQISTTLQTTTSSATATSKTSVTTTSSATGPLQTKWGQCGGTGYTGPTACVAGSTCVVSNQYYSQCL